MDETRGRLWWSRVKRWGAAVGVICLVWMLGPGVAVTRADDALIEPLAAVQPTLADIKADTAYIRLQLVSIADLVVLMKDRQTSHITSQHTSTKSHVTARVKVATDKIDGVAAQATAIGNLVVEMQGRTASSVGQVNTNVNSVGSGVTANREVLIGADGRGGIRDQVSTVNGTVNGINNNVNTINSRTNTINTNVNTANSRLSSIISSFSDVEDAIADSITRTNSVGNRVDEGISRTSAVDTRVQSVQTQMNTLEAELAELADQLADAQAATIDAINAAAGAGVDMSPMVEAWGSVRCAEQRDVPWWSLTTANPSGQIWDLDESNCAIQRGDLRELAERVGDRVERSQELSDARTGGQRDEQAEISRSVERAVREMGNKVADRVGESMESNSDRLDDLIGEVRESRGDIRSLGGSGDVTGFGIDGSGIGLAGFGDAASEKLDSWMEPAQCIADVGTGQAGSHQCGGGPVLRIPMPGAMADIEWRPFSWCFDSSAFVFAREVGGFALIAVAMIGFVKKILAGVGYTITTEQQVQIAAAKKE